jgi:hypothetical protein
MLRPYDRHCLRTPHPLRPAHQPELILASRYSPRPFGYSTTPVRGKAQTARGPVSPNSGNIVKRACV